MNVPENITKALQDLSLAFYVLNLRIIMNNYTYKCIRLNLFITQLRKTRFCVKINHCSIGTRVPPIWRQLNIFQSRARSGGDCSVIVLYHARSGAPASAMLYTSSRARSGEAYDHRFDELLPLRNLISTPIHHIEPHIDYMPNNLPLGDRCK